MWKTSSAERLLNVFCHHPQQRDSRRDPKGVSCFSSGRKHCVFQSGHLGRGGKKQTVTFFPSGKNREAPPFLLRPLFQSRYSVTGCHFPFRGVPKRFSTPCFFKLRMFQSTPLKVNPVALASSSRVMYGLTLTR